MTTFSVLDGTGLDQLAARFVGREARVEAELAKAINKAARESINLSIEEWRAFATARDYIDGRLYIASGAKVGRLEARVQAHSRATRADRFTYRPMPNRGGVYLNIRRGSPGGVLENAFMRVAKSDQTPIIIKRKKKYQKGEPRNMKASNGIFSAAVSLSINQHFHDSRERVGPLAMSAAKAQFLRAMSE